ncbi:class I SAM-dependent methyltransferase [Actinosynnema sp. NPDC002837]
MFGTDLAAVYDLVYSERGQDFASEAELVTTLVRDRAPGAASLLDVGCGTGEHLVTLAKHFTHVEGVDLAEPMVAVARAKLPDVAVHIGDMTALDLGRTYDAIISLSAAVAYLPSADAMGIALKNMASHLAPGGVLVVEPWYFPENFLDGHIAADIIRGAGRTISRVSRSRAQDGATHIESHWVVADADAIRHFTETHVFGLWTREQYDAAFAAAGCTAEYVPDVQLGRGLFVARQR